MALSFLIDAQSTKVSDPKALTINYWNRYLKAFWPVVRKKDMVIDLQQQVEVIALEISGLPLQDAGKVLGKSWRQFLKNMGLRKRAGYWVFRELGHGPKWWESVEEMWDGKNAITDEFFKKTGED